MVRAGYSRFQRREENTHTPYCLFSFQRECDVVPRIWKKVGQTSSHADRVADDDHQVALITVPAGNGS